MNPGMMYGGGYGYSGQPYGGGQANMNPYLQQAAYQAQQAAYASQQQPQQPQPTVYQIPAREINALNDIAPNEVPSDGSPALFMASDRSRIFLKEVTQNGTIATFEYVKTQENDQTQSSDEKILDAVMARLDSIEQMIKKNNSYRPRYKQKPNQQKGNNQ